MEPIQTNQEGNNSNNEKNVIVSGNLSVELENSGINDIVKAISKETTTENQTENRIATIYTRQWQQMRKANGLAFAANIISLLLFAATISVFALNLKGVDAAYKSAATANSTLQELKRQNLFHSDCNFSDTE